MGSHAWRAVQLGEEVESVLRDVEESEAIIP